MHCYNDINVSVLMMEETEEQNYTTFEAQHHAAASTQNNIRQMQHAQKQMHQKLTKHMLDKQILWNCTRDVQHIQ